MKALTPLSEVHTAAQFAAVAQDRLHRSPYPELRRIHCRLANGVLSLHGRVSRFYLKQMAQSLILQQFSEVPLENQVEVIES